MTRPETLLPRAARQVVKFTNDDNMGLVGYNKTLGEEDVAFNQEKDTNVEWECRHSTTRYVIRLIVVRRDTNLSLFIMQGRNMHMEQSVSPRRRDARQVAWKKLSVSSLQVLPLPRP